MKTLKIIVNRYHEMFANVLNDFATGLTHNPLALAVKETTGSHNVEALGHKILVDGEEYIAIESDREKTTVPLTNITKPIEITYEHIPKKPIKVEIAYVGAYLVDINMAQHPSDGFRRAKILSYRDNQYLIAFFHDCLITHVPSREVHKHGIFSHNVKEIDKNAGVYNY